jgi:seryl-tRNA synthetase
MTTEIDNIIERISRSSDQFDVFCLSAAETTKNLKKAHGDLKQEVTLLRTTHNEISETIRQSIKVHMPELSEMTKKTVNEFLEKEIKQLSEPMKKLAQEWEQCVKEIRYEQKEQKNKLKKTGALICFSFCLGSVLSGIGLWYFFPQSATHTIAFTHEQRKHMEQGTLLSFALPKMSKAEQEKIGSIMGDSWKEYYEKMFNVKIPHKKGQ